MARERALAEGSVVFDPFDPRFHSDPGSLYAELRSQSPIHRSSLGFWVLTRHADCLAVLRDRRSSSDGRKVDPASVDAPVITQTPEGPAAEMFEELAPFLFRDPPDHTRLRGLVQKAFTPRVVESLRSEVVDIADSLIDEALERGEADLIGDFAHPLPVRIIAKMLGVPDTDLELFKTWSDALARGLDPDFLLPEDAVQQRLESLFAFVQYFGGLVSDRRGSLGDDLLSKLIEAEENGVTLSQGELISTCILILVAGHETTVNLIGSGLLELMRRPDQLERFRTDPGVVRSGVEEMLRYCSPVQMTGRVPLADIEVGDVVLQKGEFAMLLIGSANRDPDVFSEPETFDISREDNPHLGFGFGIHHCLGAALARLEAQVAISRLLSRTGSLELATDELPYKENIVLRGLEALPVRLSG